jgi:hypothetical protein
VFGINQTTALVAGYIGSNTWVYRTSNSGANWTQVFTETGGFINAVWVRLNGTGFMMGDPLVQDGLVKTTNNGVNRIQPGFTFRRPAQAEHNNSMAVDLTIWFGTNNTRFTIRPILEQTGRFSPRRPK